MDINKYAENPAATLKLKHPIKWGDDCTITHLYFRRPKFKDIRVSDDKNGMKVFANIMCRITGATPPFIDELDSEDFMEASRIVKVFMPDSPEDGDSGSEPSPEE